MFTGIDRLKMGDFIRNCANGLIILLVALMVSCEQNPKKQDAVIHHVDSPAGAKSSLPYLVSNSDTALLSWVEKIGDSTVGLKYSQFLEGKWQAPGEIISGNDWFVNWADFPAITENNGHLLSYILKRSSEGTYSYDVKLNLLPKGQPQWKTDLPLHTDSTATEHGFVTILPYGRDSFFVTWLDGRNTSAIGHQHSGAMSLRAAEVSITGLVLDETLLDDRTCDCCQTTAAITANGPIVIYRDRSGDEVRDISIVRKVNGSWTKPEPIHNDNWKINGCPVNGPKCATIGNNLAVAWYTEADNDPRINVVFSGDGGESFDRPLQIEESDAIGRVDVLLMDGENAIVSWMGKTEGSARFKAVKANRWGKVNTPLVIGEIDASRKSGFPQMELIGDKVYFAWTNVLGETENIQMAYVPLDSF